MNNAIKMLYDAAKSDTQVDENGLPKMDEAKLRRELKRNNMLGVPNKERYKKDRHFHSCPRYNPCPICNKCMNKASHLFVSCRVCEIPTCAHTHEDKVRMIRRDNFELYVDDDTMKAIMELDEQVTGNAG